MKATATAIKSLILGKSKSDNNQSSVNNRLGVRLNAITALVDKSDEGSVGSAQSSTSHKNDYVFVDSKKDDFVVVDNKDVSTMADKDKKLAQVKVTEEGFGLIKNLNQSNVTLPVSDPKTEEEKKQEQKYNNALKTARNLGYSCVKEKDITKDYELVKK